MYAISEHRGIGSTINGALGCNWEQGVELGGHNIPVQSISPIIYGKRVLENTLKHEKINYSHGRIL